MIKFTKVVLPWQSSQAGHGCHGHRRRALYEISTINVHHVRNIAIFLNCFELLGNNLKE